MKKRNIFLVFALLIAQYSIAPTAHAASAGDVAINEIAWMGTVDNTNDEYIELVNTTNTPIDLTGWYIIDDGTTTYAIESGTIAPQSFFLIEDTENTVNTISADAIIGLSLANTGDTLILYDNNDVMIDTVNSAGTMWAGGDNTSKATMERIDALQSGNDPANWDTNQAPSGDLGSVGSPIIGTPRTVNSVSTFTGTTVSGQATNPNPGENWIVPVVVHNVTDLFSYGIELNYDQTQLSLIGVDQGDFLNENLGVSTSFHYGIDSLNNHLIVGEARTQNTKTTVSGSGTLLTLTFQVLGENDATGTLDFLGSSFLGGLQGDKAAVFQDIQYVIGGGGTNENQVTNVQVNEGLERYSLTLTWDAPVSGADSYNIYRTNPFGVYELIGTTTDVTFTDDDSTQEGGDIVPLVTYEYGVTALLGNSESVAVIATGNDTRGLLGDNNRSDRIDGRDLESLALHFSETYTDAEFDRLIDTSYDGFIDGDDLIHIGAGWAQNYVQ